MPGHVALQCEDAFSWQSPRQPPRPGTRALFCVSAPGSVSRVTQGDQNQRGFFPLMRGKSTAWKSVRPRFRTPLFVGVFGCCGSDHRNPGGLQAPWMSLQFCRARLDGGVGVGPASSLLRSHLAEAWVSARLASYLETRAFRWLAESSSWWPQTGPRCPFPCWPLGDTLPWRPSAFLLMWSLHLPGPRGVLFTRQVSPSLSATLIFGRVLTEN